jgi:hypothetical protein
MEVIFQGPIFVNNLDYDAYLSAHRADVERLRAEVEAAKAKINQNGTTSDLKDDEKVADSHSAGQKV